MLDSLKNLRMVTALQAVIITATLLAGVVSATATHRDAAATPGHLARLLATGRSGVIAAHLAPSARAELGEARLKAAWSVAVDEVGPLERLNHHFVVHEDAGTQDEVEVLQFAHGTGVLTAQRTPAGITGLVLLVSAMDDPAAAESAAAYARDLVTGSLEPVRAHFNPQMTAALPPALFTAETATETAGLQPPVTVAGQIVVRRDGFTVVETYLLFRNGLRRIEMTLGADGSIAGLYIRQL